MRIITFDIDGDWPESVKNPYYKPNDLARENTAYWKGVCAAYDSAIEIPDADWRPEEWQSVKHNICECEANCDACPHNETVENVATAMLKALMELDKKRRPQVQEDCCPDCGVAFTGGCNCEPYRKGG